MTWVVYPYLSEVKRTSELLIESERCRPFFFQIGTRTYYYDKDEDEIVMMEKIW